MTIDPHCDNWAGNSEYQGHRPGTRCFTDAELRARDEAIIRATLREVGQYGVPVYEARWAAIIATAASVGDTP